jgi:hypothetical protein
MNYDEWKDNEPAGHLGDQVVMAACIIVAVLYMIHSFGV